MRSCQLRIRRRRIHLSASLNEAFLYSEAIDVTTYGRQRDKLREELMLAKIDQSRRGRR